MSRKTKQTFVIAVIALFVSVSVFVVLFYKIEAQGKLMEEQISIMNKNNGKEVIFNHINHLMLETDSDRTKVANLYLSDESDSIKLLNEIETLAPTFGLKFKTEALEKIEAIEGEEESVKITFSYSGRKQAVLGFTKMIESIPHHSVVNSLALKEIGTSDFEGRITVHVTIEPAI